MNIQNENTVLNPSPSVVAEVVTVEPVVADVLGNFHEYDSQLEVKGIVGTRIVKCLYQINKKLGLDSDGNGKKDQESVYVRIPVAHISEQVVTDQIATLAPYIVSYLQSIEDGMIKADHKKGLEYVYTDGLSLEKVVNEMERLELGARLNKEMIEAWFTDEISDSLMVRFAEKLGIDDNSGEAEMAKLELILKAYQAKFSSLASGKTFLKESDCVAMLGVIKTCSSIPASSLGLKLVAKLEAMSTKEEDLLLSL